MKITNDINNHNKTDAEKVNEVFKMKRPYITYALIIINVLLYFIPLLTGSYDKLINDFCIYAPAIKSGELYRLFTGIFLHGNLLHLAFNCYALYILGMQLESFMGKVKSLIIYLFAGLTGALFSMIFSNYSASIGASGAIFGIMGAIVYFGYHYRVYLGNVIKSQIIPVIVLNLAIGFLSSGIDNFAHIGGLIGGFLITMGLGIKYKSSTSQKINGWVLSIIFLAFTLYMAFFYTV